MRLLILIILIVLAPVAAFAQGTPTPSDGSKPPQAQVQPSAAQVAGDGLDLSSVRTKHNQAGQNQVAFTPITPLQVWVLVIVSTAGVLVFIGQFFLLHRVSPISSDDIVKNCTITLVILGALVLIVAGYNSQQTAQAFGLFGTIVGYLLGRSAGKGDIAAAQAQPAAQQQQGGQP